MSLELSSVDDAGTRTPLRPKQPHGQAAGASNAGFATTMMNGVAPSNPKTHPNVYIAQANYRNQKEVQVGKPQPIMEERRPMFNSNSTQTQSASHIPVPVNLQIQNQSQVQSGNGHSNLELPSWTVLDSGSIDAVSPSDISARDAAKFTKLLVATEANSPYVGQTNANSNIAPGANASASGAITKLNKNSDLSQRERLKITCSPQCQYSSQIQAQAQLYLQTESQIASPGPQKKRKRESLELESRIKEQSLQGSHLIASLTSSTTSPSLASTSSVDINGREAKLTLNVDANMNPDPNSTPLSDMSIDSDNVMSHQPTRADVTQCQDRIVNAVKTAGFGIFTNGTSESSANVASEVFESTVKPELQVKQFPVAIQSCLATPSQQTTIIPINPRSNPKIANQVGDLLQSLVATTGMDSKFMFRLAKELHETKKRLNNGISSDTSAFSAQLMQKDNEIEHLKQQLVELKKQYEAAVGESRRVQAENMQFHQMHAAKNKEIEILVGRNRELEMNLGNVRSEKDFLTQQFSRLQNEYHRRIGVVPSDVPPQINTVVQNRLLTDSSVIPVSPTTTVAQQLGMTRISPHIALTRTVPVQSPSQMTNALSGSGSMVAAPRARVTARAGLNEGPLRRASQPTAVPSAYRPDPQGPIGGAARHYPTRAIVPNVVLAIPPTNHPIPTQQQPQQPRHTNGSPAAQYQLVSRQIQTQNQLLSSFENGHVSRLPVPHTIPSSTPIFETQRHLPQHYIHSSSVHGQATRRHSDSVMYQGSDVRDAAMKQGAMVPYQVNPYPAPQVGYYPLPSKPLDPNQASPSYTTSAMVASPNRLPSHSTPADQKNTTLIPLTEMQLTPDPQVSLPGPPAVIDLTNDEDEINTLGRSPTKRLRVEEETETEAKIQDVIPTSANLTVRTHGIIVDDVKVEGDNEPMDIVERIAESRVAISAISPSTTTQPQEGPPLRSVVDSIDSLDPDVVKVVSGAFEDAPEEGSPLRFCFFCWTRQEENSQPDWTSITSLKDPTLEEMYNHVKQVHPLVLEAVHSGRSIENEQGKE